MTDQAERFRRKAATAPSEADAAAWREAAEAVAERDHFQDRLDVAERNNVDAVKYINELLDKCEAAEAERDAIVASLIHETARRVPDECHPAFRFRLGIPAVGIWYGEHAAAVAAVRRAAGPGGERS